MSVVAVKIYPNRVEVAADSIIVCGGHIRPDATLYQENLPDTA